RRPAHRARGRVGVGWTVVGDPVAGLCDVAGPRRRAAQRSARSRRVLGTGSARAGAGLGHVAWPGRRPADHSGVPRRVLARGAQPIALVDGADVSVVRAGRPRTLLGVVRAARAAAVTELGDVALVCGRPALRRAGGEGVRRTRTAHPVTGLGHVAGAGCRAARRTLRSLRVRRAARAGAGAGLGRVADSARRATHRAGVAGGMLAFHADAVADVGGAWVAVVHAAGAARLARVGRALRAVAGARLRDVALAGRRPAHRARGSEPVGRAVVAGAVAGLGDVTGPCGRATDAAGGAFRVGRTGCARARADLGHVAHAARGAADRPGGDEGAARGAARPAVALFTQVDDAVAAVLPVRGDRRRPLTGRLDGAVGRIGARRRDHPVLRVEGDLLREAVRDGVRRRVAEARVGRSGDEIRGVLRLDADRADEQLARLGGDGRRPGRHGASGAGGARAPVERPGEETR